MQEDSRTRWLCDNLRLIVAFIVDDAVAIQVEPCINSHGRIIVQITVSSEEIGKLIGKDGRMVEALRGYVKAYEEKHGGRYGVAVRGR